MAKARKPIWLKILIWVISTILSIVALLGVGCAFLYFKYEINVFALIGQVRTLNEEVNVTALIPNAYTDEDMASAKIVTDVNMNGLIKYSEEDGYSVSFDQMSTMLGDIRFTDKQVGAIINNIIENQESFNIQIGEDIDIKEYGFKVEQIAFSNITEKETDFNIVIKLDLTKIKQEKMNDFPLNWVKKAIPDKLYCSATSTITKGENPFEYTIAGKDLKLNNLTSEETASLFKAFDTVTKIGTAKNLAETICGTFINVLIGNEENAGVAYILKDAGATDFSFETDNTENYFVIEL